MERHVSLGIDNIKKRITKKKLTDRESNRKKSVIVYVKRQRKGKGREGKSDGRVKGMEERGTVSLRRKGRIIDVESRR